MCKPLDVDRVVQKIVTERGDTDEAAVRQVLHVEFGRAGVDPADFEVGGSLAQRLAVPLPLGEEVECLGTTGRGEVRREHTRVSVVHDEGEVPAHAEDILLVPGGKQHLGLADEHVHPLPQFHPFRRDDHAASGPGQYRVSECVTNPVKRPAHRGRGELEALGRFGDASGL
ncbi:hypothetical protein GCM10027091_64180 [Streptomyces daliensis]